MGGRKLTWWVDEDSGSTVVHWETLPDDYEEPAEVELPCSTDALRRSLAKLTEKQRFVMELRWGMRGGEIFSHEEIGDLMGISKQAVQAIERRSLSTLRWSLTTLTEGA